MYTYRELHTEVQRMAAVLKSLGVGKGDRVLIYMPMVPEAIFAMLATVRLGAIHSVVFGGFAAQSLATRIEDAQPKVMLIADAGIRGGKVVPYKTAGRRILTAMRSASLKSRGRKPRPRPPVRLPWKAATSTTLPCAPPTWMPRSHAPSSSPATPVTSSTPPARRASQKACSETRADAVALAASMKHIYDAHPGETYFATSDIGWVVGHSYITYGPLIRAWQLSSTRASRSVPMPASGGRSCRTTK